MGDWLAFPCAETLSKVTQQDRKTVLKNLKALESSALIFPAGKTGRTGQVTVWRLPVVASDRTVNRPKNGTLSSTAKRPKNGIDESSKTVPLFHSKSTNIPSEASQKRDTEPVRNPKEPKKKRSTSLDAARTAVLPEVAPQVLSDWMLVRKAKRAGPVTTTVAQILRTEAEKAGLSVQAAIEICCHRGWQSFNAGWNWQNTPTGTSSHDSRGNPLESNEVFGAVQ